MIRNDDLKLLSDLNHIVVSHGPEALIRLANLIRDPQTADDIAKVLESVATHAQQTRAPRRTRARKEGNVPNIGSGVIKDLEDSAPRKFACLTEFRDQLVSGDRLRTMREIRQFAMAHDLVIGKASSRNTAIPPLLRSMAQLDESQIQALLTDAAEFDLDARGLAHWSDLILTNRSAP